MKHAAATAAVSTDQIHVLKELVDERGLNRVADEVEIPATTLVRVLSGLPVRRGTRVLLERGLAHADEGAGG